MTTEYTMPHGTLARRLRTFMGVGVSALCIAVATAGAPCYAMEVTPIMESAPVADLPSSDPWPRSTYRNDIAFPPPAWTSGNPLPAQEWERISRRPGAFDPLPITERVARATPQTPYSGASSPALPRISGPDPATLPVQPLSAGSRTSRPANQPSMTSTSTTITGQGVTVPTVTTPTVPGVAAPSVNSPTAPSVANPATPSGVRPNPTAAAPYSATASPTGPVAPSSPAIPTTPAVNAPASPAVQSTPAVSATAPPQPAGTTNGSAAPPAVQNPTGASAGSGAGSAGVTGSLQTAPVETPRPRAPVIGGPAESLVIPPAGISLTPNNGAGALTSPSVSK